MRLKAGAFVVCQEGQEVKSFRSNYFVFLFCTPLKQDKAATATAATAAALPPPQFSMALAATATLTRL